MTSEGGDLQAAAVDHLEHRSGLGTQSSVMPCAMSNGVLVISCWQVRCCAQTWL